MFANKINLLILSSVNKTREKGKVFVELGIYHWKLNL